MELMERRRILLNTPHTNIITGLKFVTDMVAPLESLVISFSPIQDLHGYSYPWPAGGGKNMFDKSIPIQDNWYDDNGVEQTSTSTGHSVLMKAEPSTGYTLSGTLKKSTAFNTGFYFWDSNETFISRSVTGATSAQTVTTPSNCAYISLQLSTPTGAETSEMDINTIQLEKGSSATSYAPYSNICPISGWQGMSVKQTGKNLFDKNAVTVSSITVYSSNGTESTRQGFEYHLPAGTYTLRCNSENVAAYIYMNVVDADRSFVSFAMLSQAVTSGWKTVTVTLTEGQYILVYKGTTTALSLDFDLQIELGSDATSYEEYQGQTYSVTFPALGKNLLNPSPFASFKQADGTYRLTGATATVTKVNFPAELVGKEITLSVYLDLSQETAPSSIRLRAVINDENINGIAINNGATGYSTVTVTPTSTDDLFYMTYGSNGSNYYTFSQLQIEYGSTKTSYEPYTNTVYGGTLDMVSGVLTVEWKYGDMGDLAWGASSNANSSYVVLSDTNAYAGSSSEIPKLYIDSFNVVSLGDFNSNVGTAGYWASVNATNRFYIMSPDLQGMTSAQVQEFVKGMKYAIYLATPQTIQLTPQQILAFKGTNNLSMSGQVKFWTHRDIQ